MSLSHPTRLLASTVGALAITAGLVVVPAHAAPATTTVPAGSVAAVTDRIAARLAGEFADEARRSGLLSATSTDPVLLTRAAEGTELGRAVRDADRDVLAAKALPQDGTSLLTIRLAHADMTAALRRGASPLIASSPADDTPTTVTAYDRTGRRIALAADRVPSRPVYLVEVDTATALAKGTEVLRSTLAQRGLSPAAARAAVTPASGYWATQVTSIRLNDDHEPWHKGDAEIFTISAGFGLDGKVKVDTTQLPYLDDDGKTYYPNQLLVHFSDYKYNLADIVMMEEDGGTNYRDLALALTQALLTIIDGGAYIPLVTAIINALPDDWWTDDPDYVESWYTLSTATSGTLHGAAGNGTMTVTPYWVAPL
ncbi:DUF3103 family protein [Saccharothrix luteola]|uniref:DUF3103 family protein n=1 Tax=Saccharothrix luteola TaxID=2893018 RepID=UPI001E378FB0|nr:DUF3103 family protein [Saccharothrix luteola]MCC8249759.1 DUF3103 domain-containing protein [Saccharothrix luteola]